MLLLYLAPKEIYIDCFNAMDGRGIICMNMKDTRFLPVMIPNISVNSRNQYLIRQFPG